MENGTYFLQDLKHPLNHIELFTSVAEAELLTNQYRESYNTTRAHSSLGYLSPHEFLALDVRAQRMVLTRSAK
ncbi:integrase core domain-containing protein [Ferrimicrobium sp.]|uniref:integrase core domain-containing protein n=1 Tax=Ferrimicrobium sp. TaxID=2926050 RepID=UPI002616A2F2|nr:integrase core domain-containing protein [Ferrimicrobium sp.]